MVRREVDRLATLSYAQHQDLVDWCIGRPCAYNNCVQSNRLRARMPTSATPLAGRSSPRLQLICLEEKLVQIHPPAPTDGDLLVVSIMKNVHRQTDAKITHQFKSSASRTAYAWVVIVS
jgi:hypothetical protein